jgi:hypothetical protein
MPNQILHLFLALCALCILPGRAQFFNFGNMFGQQQQAQEPQNMASDSDWYQQNYETGMFCVPPHFTLVPP